MSRQEPLRLRPSQATARRLDNLHAAHPQENPVLHGQPDHSVRPDIVPQRLHLLPAGGCWRKDDHVRLHPPRSHRIPAPRLKDLASDITHSSSDRQVPPLHIRHEHICNRPGCLHHKLEFQDAKDAPNAQMGASSFHQISIQVAADGEARAARSEACQILQQPASFVECTERSREKTTGNGQCRREINEDRN